MTPALREYTDYLARYAGFLETMAGDEQTQYDALVSFNAEQLNHAMAGLQSGMMQLEQMEERRIGLQRAAGLGDHTFGEILRGMPAEERPELEELFQRIQLSVGEIKFLNEKALQFAKEGLASIHTGQVDPQHNLYTPPAQGSAKSAAASSPVFDAEY